jgi:hypothetical protein
MLKSATFTVIITEWAKVPFVPITTTVYERATVEVVAVKVIVEDPVLPGARLIVDELRTIPGPAGETLDVNRIVPEKPLRLVRKTVAFEEPPALRKIKEGVASIEKSRPVTATGIVRVLDRLPFVAVTVTL